MLLVVASIPMLFFSLYSLGFAIYLSSFRYPAERFSGLYNLTRVLSDHEFRASLNATSVYVSLTVGSEVLLGTVFSVAVHRTVRSGFLRAVIYLLFIIPIATPSVVAGVIFRLLFIPRYCLIDAALLKAHVISASIPWLFNPRWAMVSVVVADVWRQTPLVFLILFSGLQAVPKDIVEAASLDGAPSWHLFRYVELIYLKRLLMVVGVLRLSDSFRVFDHVFLLTGGGPGNATEFLSLYLVLPVSK